MTTLPTIGLAVARLLHAPHYAASANRYIYIASFNPHQNEILASLENATGQTWKREYRDAAETRRKMLERGIGGDMQAVEENLIACHYS